MVPHLAMHPVRDMSERWTQRGHVTHGQRSSNPPQANNSSIAHAHNQVHTSESTGIPCKRERKPKPRKRVHRAPLTHLGLALKLGELRRPRVFYKRAGGGPRHEAHVGHEGNAIEAQLADVRLQQHADLHRP